LMARDLGLAGAGLRDGLARCPAPSAAASSASADGVAARAQADLDQRPSLPGQLMADQALLEAARQASLATTSLSQAAAADDGGQCASARAAVDQLDRSLADAAAAAAVVTAQTH
jgi:hypothetical protein